MLEIWAGTCDFKTESFGVTGGPANLINFSAEIQDTLREK